MESTVPISQYNWLVDMMKSVTYDQQLDSNCMEEVILSNGIEISKSQQI